MKSPEIMEALVRLGTNPDFQLFLEGVRALQVKAQSQANTCTDLVLIGRGQGGVLFLGEILDDAKHATDNLMNYRKRLNQKGRTRS